MGDVTEDLGPEQAERMAAGLAAMIGQVMAEALRTEDPAALRLEVRRLLPQMAPDLAAAAADDAALRSLEACLARGIWNAAPVASNGYRPRPLPEPDRNGPCPCGSGSKYKRCCARLVHVLPAITPEAAWQALSGHLAPKDAQRVLDAAGLPPEALAPLARRVHELSGARGAWKRLEPHLAVAAKLDARHAEALTLAFDLDAELRGEVAAMERALAQDCGRRTGSSGPRRVGSRRAGRPILG